MISKAVYYSQFPMDDYGASHIDRLEDEEDDDDDLDADVERPRVARRGIPLAAQRNIVDHDHDVLHLITYSFIEAKRVLFQPIEFFEVMPVKGGFVEPSIFLCICAFVYAGLSAFGGMDALVFFKAFFSSILYTSIGAFLATKILNKGFDGKGDFEGTFRVFAFSKATLLFAWISVGHFVIGGYLALAYTVVLNTLGISKIHELDKLKTAGLIAGMAIVQFAIHLLIHF